MLLKLCLFPLLLVTGGDDEISLLKRRVETLEAQLKAATETIGKLEKENEELKAGRGNGKKRDSVDSAFAAGSKWKGTVRELKAGSELTTDVLVTITKRDNQEFKGTYEVFSGSHVYSIEGTIERNQVIFRFVKLDKEAQKGTKSRNLVGVENKGTLRLDAKTGRPTLITFYTWQDAKDAGIAKGTVSLSLVE